MTHLTNPSQPTNTTRSNHARSWWQFALPLAFQLSIAFNIVAQSAYTFLTGQSVMLKTVPVDPYNWLTGYSQTLRYDISNLDQLKQLPGWQTIVQQQQALAPEKRSADVNGIEIYVVLQSQAQVDAPWQAIAVAPNKPPNLAQNQVALRGKIAYNTVEYGLETYYMPEARKDEVNQIIRENQTKQPAIVNVKVDRNGNAVPIQIKVAGQVLKF